MVDDWCRCRDAVKAGGSDEWYHRLLVAGWIASGEYHAEGFRCATKWNVQKERMADDGIDAVLGEKASDQNSARTVTSQCDRIVIIRLLAELGLKVYESSMEACRIDNKPGQIAAPIIRSQIKFVGVEAARDGIE